MKTIPLEDLLPRRAELLAALARGEIFAVTTEGQEIGTLLPRRVSGSEEEQPGNGAAAVIAAEKAGEASVDELATDLAGSVAGPGDLTTNPGYWADYGQPRQRQPAGTC
ncbi:MAG: hypothetical protein JO117_07535 [Verrucomicrobia bacterium]|nr:hypothetical protein [Verrucomicrobiota bacterium]MBV9658257.1 hypothetical protein [Verrucomicrobiota bacterium]